MGLNARALDASTSNVCFRAIWRIPGVFYTSCEAYETRIDAGERIVRVEPDAAGRGLWLTTTDGEEILVDSGYETWLVTEAEWLADGGAA